MKNLAFLFIISLFIPSMLLANNQDWCEPAVDLSSDFPEVIKNQDDLGYCYAFSATSLVENYACRTEKNCNSLSAMDAISLYPYSINTVGKITDTENETYQEGGWSAIALQKIRNEGICPEEFAPYNEQIGILSARESWDTLLEGYNAVHNGTTCYETATAINDLYEQLGYSASIVDENRLGSALSKPNGREYLRHLFISEACKENRQKYNYSIHAQYTPYLEKNDHVQKNIYAISDKLNQRIPVSIGIKCYPESPLCPCNPNESECIKNELSHALVIKGMRKNPTTKKCELLFLNSWKKDWQDKYNGGYIEADSVLSDIHEVVWLE